MTAELQGHLSNIQLDALVFADQALSATEQAHLDACPACQARREKLLLLRTELDIARRSAPSPEALTRYAKLYDEVVRRSLGDRIAEALDRVRLSLSLDSRQTAEAMGLRHGFGLGRRLLFSAAEVDVELLVEQSGNRWALHGDILPVHADNISGPYLVQLMQQPLQEKDPGAASEYLTESEAAGRFRLEDVRPGRYALLVTPADGPLIEIPTLDLS
ncbi:MAG: hypothetical protein D6790_11520 [Caldilineae bacterium]|nr:MAG: hypothetical protein D6790_11520 [Caldilineae bacterium]